MIIAKNKLTTVEGDLTKALKTVNTSTDAINIILNALRNADDNYSKVKYLMKKM